MENKMANLILNDNRLSSGGADFIMVAVIDFGTTYSGYAFSFKNEPDAVRMNKSWGASLGVQMSKTPTCVLLNPQGEFVAFGFDAEKQYGEILETDEYGGSWSLFRHFKMTLHQNENLNRSTTIEASSGVKKPAMDIFVMALRYLKQHLLDTVSLAVAKPPESSMVRWVITVPAIWSDESKRFMRESAFRAGFMKSVDSHQLVIALEPETASLHCRCLDVAEFVGEPDKDSVVFKTGTKYMVIDAGGGTVDITVHQILPNGSVRELHAATGGAWGGTKVDENFIDLLRNILGRDFIEKYQKKCPQQWLNLMLNFEKMKKNAKVDGGSLNIPLVYGMDDKYTEFTGKNFQAEIKRCSNMGVVFSQGNFVIKPPTVKQLFQPVVNKMINHMEDLLGNRITHPCKYLFLVGGFSESKFLQQIVMDRFAGRLDVLIPNEAQLSVIRGAVKFGHEPEQIKSRIARRTYGCDYSETFEPGKHKPAKMQIIDGVPNCTDLLKVFLKKGEEVEVGTKRSLSFVPGSSKQTAMGFKFYCLDDKPKEIQYLDEPGVKQLGTATVQMPDVTGGKSREVELVVTFGGTEIEIYAKDATSGNIASTKLDFLAG